MILADTGPLLGLFDPRDASHQVVLDWLSTIPRGEVVSVCSTVVAEVAYFLPGRVGIRAEAAFLRFLGSGAYPILDPVAADYLRAADLVEQYADFPLGTVDALIVAMAERLNVTTIFTLDRRHFGAIKPLHCESFTLVP